MFGSVMVRALKTFETLERKQRSSPELHAQFYTWIILLHSLHIARDLCAKVQTDYQGTDLSSTEASFVRRTFAEYAIKWQYQCFMEYFGPTNGSYREGSETLLARANPLTWDIRVDLHQPASARDSSVFEVRFNSGMFSSGNGQYSLI